jgi:hypothetical protein
MKSGRVRLSASVPSNESHVFAWNENQYWDHPGTMTFAVVAYRVGCGHPDENKNRDWGRRTPDFISHVARTRLYIEWKPTFVH